MLNPETIPFPNPPFKRHRWPLLMCARDLFCIQALTLYREVEDQKMGQAGLAVHIFNEHANCRLNEYIYLPATATILGLSCSNPLLSFLPPIFKMLCFCHFSSYILFFLPHYLLYFPSWFSFSSYFAHFFYLPLSPLTISQRVRANGPIYLLHSHLACLSSFKCSFLDASTHLYKWVCQSISWSVGPLVIPLVHRSITTFF